MKETSNIHLLLVDDNIRYLDILERRLRQFGYQYITTAHNTVDARTMLEEQKYFDVIVSDMRMERDDSGFDIIDLVQDLKLPCVVIILTANDTVHDARKVLQVKKAWDYISKSSETSAIELLHESIQKAIKHFNQHDIVTSQTELTVFVEGPSDVTYIKTAARLLGYDHLWTRVYLDNIGNQIGNEVGGKNNMNNGFNFLKYNPRFRPHKVLFLFDQDVKPLPLKEEGNYENLYVYRAGEHDEKKKGSEYLFDNLNDLLVAGFSAGVVSKTLVETANNPNPKPIYNIITKGKFCTWLCTQHLTQPTDFANFEPIFQLIQEILAS